MYLFVYLFVDLCNYFALYCILICVYTDTLYIYASLYMVTHFSIWIYSGFGSGWWRRISSAANNARGGVISIAIHEPTNLLYGVNGQGSLYKIPLRSLAEIEAPDIFDFLIIPLFSVLSGGLGGWYIG